MEENISVQTERREEPKFTLLNNPTNSESATVPDPNYKDGTYLPSNLRKRLLREAKPCVPLKEIDPYYFNKQTFVVISSWGSIHRFSSKSEGCIALNSDNLYRKLAIYLLTNRIFSIVVICTVILNILISLHDNDPRKSQAQKLTPFVLFIFITIYTFEVIVKAIGRGCLGGQHTFLRDPWTWLDLLVLFNSYDKVLYISSSTLYFNWYELLPLLKVIPLIPRVRQAFNFSMTAIYRLRGMISLGLLLLWIFSLLMIQFYMGILNSKCIRDFPSDANFTDQLWEKHNQNTSNWYAEEDVWLICGNATGSRACPEKYTCLNTYGPNPDNGLTNFDNLLGSVLSTTRIATEGFTEELFTQIKRASGFGLTTVLLFSSIFFLMTFPMGCYFFATVADLLTESKCYVDEIDSEEALEQASSADQTITGIKKLIHSILFHDAFRLVLIGVIVLDTFSISSYSVHIFESQTQTRIYLIFIPYLVFVVYLMEFVLKLIAAGPIKHFKNKWNWIDCLVLLTFVFEINSYLGQLADGNIMYLLAPFRVLKLIQYWPPLRMIFKVYLQTLRMLSGWIWYGIIVSTFSVCVGYFSLAKFHRSYELSRNPVADVPRWEFTDLWSSFRIYLRIQIGEWIETFWTCDEHGYYGCIVYYLLANLSGSLLLSLVLIGIVYSSLKELQGKYCHSKVISIKLHIRKFQSHFICSKLSHVKSNQSFVADQRNIQDEVGQLDLADENNVGVPENIRKKSVDLKPTGKLPQILADIAEHRLYKTVVFSVILVSSLAMVIETSHENLNLMLGLLVIEIFFTVFLFCAVVYDILNYGIRNFSRNPGAIFEALIVLEMVLNLSISELNVFGPIRMGLFYIRPLRPLMLIHRTKEIKAPFKAFVNEIKTIWEIVLAIVFIWLFFSTFGVHWLSGLYHRCLGHEGNLEFELNKTMCLASNLSWVNNDFNFDNTADGSLNMIFLASRMGWLNVIDSASDAVGLDMPPKRDNSKMWYLYFMAFMFVGAFGAMGILFSFIYKQFQDQGGCGILLTEDQAKEYTETKTINRSKKSLIRLESEFVPPPKSECLLSIYNFVTNVKFDAIVMLIILIDNLVLSVDHHPMDTEHDTIWMSIRSGIMILIFTEMIVKLVAWRQYYFKTWRNWLDFIVAVTGISEILVAEDFVAKYFMKASILRMLRLLRIFRFLLADKYGSESMKIFFSSVYNIRHAFANLICLQLTFIWTFTILGNYMFKHVGKHGEINEVLNFKTFSASFDTLVLSMGFPALDVLYTNLSNSEDCSIEPESDEDDLCGNKAAAIGFIGFYAGITFMVLLNMYSVFIHELVSELSRSKAAVAPVNEPVALQSVRNENASNNGPEETNEESPTCSS